MNKPAEFSAINNEYKYGFTTEIETYSLPKGLSEEVIRQISAKKKEPDFMLQFRLKAYKKWQTMKEPNWQNFEYPKINYQDIVYFSAPKLKKQYQSLEEVDPILLLCKIGDSFGGAKAISQCSC